MWHIPYFWVWVNVIALWWSLTNMSSTTSPLTSTRVCEQILTEKLRLCQFASVVADDRSSGVALNPFGLKADTMFRGELQHRSLAHDAFVARNYPPNLRHHPYAQRGGTPRGQGDMVSQQPRYICGEGDTSFPIKINRAPNTYDSIRFRGILPHKHKLMAESISEVDKDRILQPYRTKSPKYYSPEEHIYRPLKSYTTPALRRANGKPPASRYENLNLPDQHQQCTSMCKAKNQSVG